MAHNELIISISLHAINGMINERWIIFLAGSVKMMKNRTRCFISSRCALFLTTERNVHGQLRSFISHRATNTLVASPGRRLNTVSIWDTRKRNDKPVVVNRKINFYSVQHTHTHTHPHIHTQGCLVKEVCLKIEGWSADASTLVMR